MGNIASHYAELLEGWENEAYEGGYGSDWLESVGEAVKFYCKNCAAQSKTPTFKGLIDYIKKVKES